MTTSDTTGGVSRIIAERYRIGPRRGSGVDAARFDAFDIQLQRLVTLRMVHPDLTAMENLRKRFRPTMDATAAVHHPNVTPVLDWGVDLWNDREMFFVVYEQLGGGSLRELLDRGRRLTPSQALVVGLDACKGLDALHRAGLLHGDIRPSTLVFGDDRRLRLVDAGLGNLLTGVLWGDKAAISNERATYAAPEQALGQPSSTKSDVYALSLSLLESVSGTVPFAGDSAVATLANRVGKLMPVSADLGSLAAVLEHAGRPDPKDRSTAAQFGRGLVQAAEKLPRPAPIPVLVGAPMGSGAVMPGAPVEPTGPLQRPDLTDVPPPPVPQPGPSPAEPPVPPVPPPVEPPAPPVPQPGLSPVEPPVPQPGPSPVEPPPVPSPVEPPVPAEPPPLPPVAQPVPVPPGPDPMPIPVPAGVAPRTATPSASPPPPPPPPPPPVDPAPTAAGPESIPVPQLYDDLRDDSPTARVPISPTLAVPATSQPRRRRRWPWVVLVVLLLAAAGTGTGLYLAKRSEKAVALRVVPELTGLSQPEASARITPGQWNTTVSQEYNETVPVGVVIRTDPVAWRPLPEAGALHLVVSQGPKPRPLPELAGQTLDQASALLAAQQLVITQAPPVYDETVPAGSVISWSVPSQPTLVAGGEVLPGTEVAVVLSQGPQPRTMPNVIGQTLEQATAALTPMGLVVAQAPDEFNNDVLSGGIVRTDPVAGTQLPRGATVTIVVSKGRDVVTFPSFPTLDFPTVTQVLTSSGFVIGSVTGDSAATLFQATINGNAATAGGVYPRGTAVDLIFLSA